jgi:hypothetical protein
MNRLEFILLLVAILIAAERKRTEVVRISLEPKTMTILVFKLNGVSCRDNQASDSG